MDDADESQSDTLYSNVKPQELFHERNSDELMLLEPLDLRYGNEMQQIFTRFLSSVSSTIEPPKDLKPEQEKRRKLNEMSPIYLPKIYHKLPDYFDHYIAPKSYIENTKHEEECLKLLDNFQRQYKLIFKDRKLLLLSPNNEYDVRKCICTFLKPVNLKYAELNDWPGAASFVSDFLNYCPLLPTTEIPKRIISMTQTIRLQRGGSFEYANLLCSLLLGVGYDAYVVNGYATRECCLMDLTRVDCPYLEVKKPADKPKSKETIKKYIVRPARDLKSKFDLYKEAKKIEEENIAKEKQRKEEMEQERLNNLPLSDSLFGLRVHAWVLIKKGLRNVDHDFFIEPTTGTKIDLKTSMYEGIESIYNHENCWVNMQDCSKGIMKMKYNLKDARRWEIVFFVPDKVEEDDIRLTYHENDSVKEPDSDIHIVDVPTSWINHRIYINRLTYEKRYPDCVKTTHYFKTICEQYSPYHVETGLWMRLKLYMDKEYKKNTEIIEYFDKRTDYMYKIVFQDNWVHEYFYCGAINGLKEYYFSKDNEQVLEFYSDQRTDGLYKRKETCEYFAEWYEKRKDNMIYLMCIFKKKLVKIRRGPKEQRIIKIIKRYERNHSKPAYDDIEELTFFTEEKRIFIKYHKADNAITVDTREFFQSPLVGVNKNVVPFYNDTHNNFTGFPRKPKTNLELYDLLLYLMEYEDKTFKAIVENEWETKYIVKTRKEDRKNKNLVLSLFDVKRNFEARKKRKELNVLAEQEKIRILEDKPDYLAPFLAQNNLDKIETKEQVFKVREDCLKDFKDSLIEKAKIIHDRYLQDIETLQVKNMYYQQNHTKFSSEEQREFLEYFKQTAIRVNILENRLQTHKEIAPRLYLDLEKKIRNDSRVNALLN